MAKDPGEDARSKDQIGAEDAGKLEDDEGEEPLAPDHPACPNCGWHNTRPSYSRNMFDTLLRTFSLRPYRCRSCGNRFRVIRRSGRD